MQEKRKSEAFSTKKFLFEVFYDVVIVIILVLVIRHFFFAPFRVSGPSMCPTFNLFEEECYNGDGEYVLSSRFATWNLFGWKPGNIERGDVIIFQAPYSPKGEYYIKRVIGLPGDTVKISDGYVHLKNEEGDFEQIEEPYLSAENSGHTEPYKSTSEVYKVPEGSFFVLGDNRLRSSDSRRCFKQVGCSGDASPFLDEALLQGEVKVVIFPLNHFRIIREHAIEF